MATQPTIVIVTRQTRLRGLRARWGTASQAKFVLAQAHKHEQLRRSEQAQQRARKIQPQPSTMRRDARRGVSRAAPDGEPDHLAVEPAPEAEFADYLLEDQAQESTIDRLSRELDFGLPVRVLDRSYLPNYDFWNTAVVVVVGQDGLVANAAKYVGDLPIVGINPDPKRFDGILVPFRQTQARAVVGRVLDRRSRHRRVTLAEVVLNDGQRMLAFNDFFIGAASHISARYMLEVDASREPQSSSGVLVSTGAGSTGWLSSVFNMASGINRQLGLEVEPGVKLAWEDRRLFWAVREPFVSKHSQANLVAGFLEERQQLILESLMPESGVIFSDGVEADFLPFTSGTIAQVGVARQTANLVVG